VTDEHLDDDARYRALVHVLDEGVVFQDGEGKVLAANDAAGRILGVDPDDLIGTSAYSSRFSAWHVDGSEVLRAEHPSVAALETGKPISNAVMKVQRADGVPVWVAISARPVFHDGASAPSGVVVSFNDVTLRRDLEALQMESLGRLAGGIAHDFNNLLGVILNYASVIAKQVSPDHRIADDARRIREAADYGTELVRQLLLFSRQEDRVARRFDLRPVVDEMVELIVRPFAPHIEVRVHHWPEECIVVADRGQLGQVLLNLLLNARDAIEGDGHITVTTTKQPGGGDDALGPVVVVAVEDDGCGMTSEVQARALEPFFTTKVDGSGLGLSAAYGSITAVGGRITIESTLDVGSIVRIVLPFDPTGRP
jgi:two-component system cell cycle sensor histidine kinase/response regulator CckA